MFVVATVRDCDNGFGSRYAQPYVSVFSCVFGQGEIVQHRNLISEIPPISSGITEVYIYRESLLETQEDQLEVTVGRPPKEIIFFVKLILQRASSPDVPRCVPLRTRTRTASAYFQPTELPNSAARLA